MPHKEILPEVIDMSLKAAPPVVVAGMAALVLTPIAIFHYCF